MTIGSFSNRGLARWACIRRTANGKANRMTTRIDRAHVRDIEATVGELRTKGAQFRGPIEQREYGRVIMMIVPGADDMQLYQPTHKLAYNL